MTLAGVNISGREVPARCHENTGLSYLLPELHLKRLFVAFLERRHGLEAHLDLRGQ